MTALPALRESGARNAPPSPPAAAPGPRPRRVSGESPQAPFRRPPVVRRHRRRRALSLLKLLLQALVIVGLPTAATAWALTSPQLALGAFHISSSARVPAPWVEEKLEPFRGRNLLRLPLPEVRRRLEGHPWLESVSLRKRLPDGLEVSIVEKTPVAVLEQGGSRAFLDPDGGIIAPVDGGSDVSGLPRIHGRVKGPRELAGAIAAAREFDRLGSPWGGRLERIDILGPEDFRLETELLPFPLVVRPGSLREKHATARRLVPEIAVRMADVAAVDLRFSQKIVLQPEPGDEGLIPPSRVPSRG